MAIWILRLVATYIILFSVSILKSCYYKKYSKRFYSQLKMWNNFESTFNRFQVPLFVYLEQANTAFSSNKAHFRFGYDF